MIDQGYDEDKRASFLRMQIEDRTRRRINRVRAEHLRMLSAAHRNFYYHPDGSLDLVMAIQKYMLDRKIVMAKPVL